MKHNIGDIVEFKQREEWCTCVGIIKEITDNIYIYNCYELYYSAWSKRRTDY